MLPGIFGDAAWVLSTVDLTLYFVLSAATVGGFKLTVCVFLIAADGARRDGDALLIVV